MLNAKVASLLREAAVLLEEQGANAFRISAYRRAADVVSAYRTDLAEIIDRRGYDGLIVIPSIGPGIARAILEINRTGQWAQLNRLRGQHAGPEMLLRIPGMGPELANRLHEQCGIETLEELEQAMADGRVASVPGFGRRRLTGLRLYLSGVLGQARPAPVPIKEPTVEELLEIDRDYRERAAEGKLFKIAPKRFNPEHERWLPVLHTSKGPWQISAFFSNTERAHQLGRTSDWVVIFFSGVDHIQGQRTVVTETHGPLQDRRVVRGREMECFDYYDVRREKAG